MLNGDMTTISKWTIIKFTLKQKNKKGRWFFIVGGEKAKSSGEYGEAIVAQIWNLIGWNNPQSGVSIPCVFKEKHGKEKHGIDYIFQYRSPLRDSTKQDVLISGKCRDGYPLKDDTTIKLFKEFLVDIAWAMECYPSCEVAKRRIQNTTKKVTNRINFLDWSKS